MNIMNSLASTLFTKEALIIYGTNLGIALCGEWTGEKIKEYIQKRKARQHVTWININD